jgi:hypothetical protein
MSLRAVKRIIQLSSDRLATAVARGTSRAFSGLFGMAETAGLELAASWVRRKPSHYCEKF